MKRLIPILLITVAVAAGAATMEAKAASKKKSTVKKSTNIVKSPVVTGDFDGDGKPDRIWTEGRYDRDGYAVGNIKLCSDNPKLGGMTWSGIMGVDLSNLGRLGEGAADLLGVIPYAISTWCEFNTYVFSGGKWRAALEPFTVWLGDEEAPLGVVKAKSGRKGFVGVYFNDMDADDEEMEKMFERKYKELQLNY